MSDQICSIKKNTFEPTPSAHMTLTTGLPYKHTESNKMARKKYVNAQNVNFIKLLDNKSSVCLSSN